MWTKYEYGVLMVWKERTTKVLGEKDVLLLLCAEKSHMDRSGMEPEPHDEK